MDPVTELEEPFESPELPGESPFPVYVVGGWDGPRYVAFHAHRHGRLREVTLGHGTRWSAQPWVEVTSFEPDSVRNHPDELAKAASEHLEGLVNDFRVRGLRQEPTGERSLDHLECIVAGQRVEYVSALSDRGITVGALITPDSRGVLVAWTGSTPPASLEPTHDLEPYREDR